jgi:hypothetical protein
MTTEEKLLERTSDFTEAKATAVLRVVETQADRVRYFGRGGATIHRGRR